MCEQTKRITNKYRPIEKDPNIDREEKLKLMEYWWKNDTGNIIKEGLTRKKFRSIAETCGVYFRNGITELLLTKKQYGIPILVVSAGIGELIREWFNIIFDENELTLEDMFPFNLVSNLGIFEEDELVNFNKPLVHIMNKASHVSKFIERQNIYDKDHGHLRGNIIVMGDVIEDLGMISDIEYDNIIKIGFLNNVETDSHLIEEYEKEFDLIVHHDGNLLTVSNMLQLIAGQPMASIDKVPENIASVFKSLAK